MVSLRRSVLVFASFLVASLGACESDSPNPVGTDIVQGVDTSAGADVVPPEDTTLPEDTTPPEDTATGPDDVTTPADTVVEDIATPQDTSVPMDVAVPEDTTPAGDTGGSGTGACNNTGDLGLLDANASTLDKTIAECAFNCFINADRLGCTKTCLTGKIALTTTCIGCFADVSVCTTVQCVEGNGGPCFSLDLNAPPSQACVDCRDTNCMPAFEACAGVALP